MLRYFIVVKVHGMLVDALKTSGLTVYFRSPCIPLSRRWVEQFWHGNWVFGIFLGIRKCKADLFENYYFEVNPLHRIEFGLPMCVKSVSRGMDFNKLDIVF